MSISLYSATVPVFIRGIEHLILILKKAEQHALDHNLDPNTLLTARLHPNMYNLTAQVQRVSDIPKFTIIRYLKPEPGTIPSFPDDEKTFADLYERLDKTLEILRAVKEEDFEGREEQEMFVPRSATDEFVLKGKEYALIYGPPNFWFHVVTAYGILRKEGVDIGKNDYLNGKNDVQVREKPKA